MIIVFSYADQADHASGGRIAAAFTAEAYWPKFRAPGRNFMRERLGRMRLGQSPGERSLFAATEISERPILTADRMQTCRRIFLVGEPPGTLPSSVYRHRFNRGNRIVPGRAPLRAPPSEKFDPLAAFFLACVPDDFFEERTI